MLVNVLAVDEHTFGQCVDTLLVKVKWYICYQGVTTPHRALSMPRHWWELPVYSLSLYNFDQNKSFNIDDYSMVKLSTIGLGVLKTCPRNGIDKIQLKKHYNTQEIWLNCLLSILCYCKYSMKEYTMHYIILNYNQIDKTKAKKNANLLNLALFPLKHLKIQNKYTLNKHKYNFTCKYKLLFHTLRDNIY